MHIISKKTLKIIQDADNGCVWSQMAVGILYRGCDDLPEDSELSSQYLTKFFEVPFEFVRARKFTSVDYYLQMLIVCGHSTAETGQYKSALEYYNRALEFSKKYFPDGDCEHLFENQKFHEYKSLIESYVNNGYDTYGIPRNLNS